MANAQKKGVGYLVFHEKIKALSENGNAFVCFDISFEVESFFMRMKMNQ